MTITRPEVPVQLITPDDVRESIARTRYSLMQAAKGIAWQVEMETWVTLGYKSWDEMREAEYGGIAVIVPKEDRLDLVGRLHAAGLTQKSIAATIGVDERTIRRDLATGQMSGADDVIEAEIVEDEEHEPRPRRRRPITDAFWTATYDLRKRVESVHRLTEDDRFQRNAETLAGHRNDLIRQRDLLNEVIDRMPKP